MAAAEVFANTPSTTVSSGGTTAPSSGTQETWTVVSSAEFPAASSGASPPTQFHVADTATGKQAEIIAVTNVSGTTWTVTRGAESTTPVTHSAGFTVYQVVSAGVLTALIQNPMTALGDGIYQDSTGYPTRLAGNTSTALKVLGQTGTGSLSAAPAWTGTGAVLASGLNVQMLTPSGGDDTAAWQAALAALPTVTVNNGVTSHAYPVGTLLLAAGTHQLGAASDVGNLGPFVNVIGPGRNACLVQYHGSGDCLRAYNAIQPHNSYFGNMFTQAAPYGLGGTWNGFIVDGTSASAGAAGIHIGDFEGLAIGPDLLIQNFSLGQLSAPASLAASAVGSGGTFSAGAYYWTITATTRTGETAASNEATATIVLNGSASLTWAARSGATGYNIYRGTATGAETTLVAQVGAVTAYTDTGSSLGSGSPPLINTSGSTGLWMDNQNAWTENFYGRAVTYNCANAVVMQGCDSATGGRSFEYNDLTFKVYVLTGQNGVVVTGGASYKNGELKIRGNFQHGTASPAAAALTVQGQAPPGNPAAGSYSVIQHSRLDFQCESDSGSNTHQTINFGTPGSNVIQACTGVLDFATFGTPTNYTNSIGPSGFLFDGIVAGDSVLNTAPTQRNPVSVGARASAIGYISSAGAIITQSGDMFQLTLSQNVTPTLANNPGMAQRMTVAFKQAAAGGPYTVTSWPSNGSPTTSSPTVIWAAGSAPVMPSTASAVMVVRLETFNGATWYGQLITKTTASPARFTPSAPAGTTSTTRVMMGLGSTCTYTPTGTGLVQVIVTANPYVLTGAVFLLISALYGTGTAPVNGAAETGTVFGANPGDTRPPSNGATVPAMYVSSDVLTLTPGTAYWFDLSLATSNASDQANLENVFMSFTELS